MCGLCWGALQTYWVVWRQQSTSKGLAPTTRRSCGATWCVCTTAVASTAAGPVGGTYTRVRCCAWCGGVAAAHTGTWNSCSTPLCVFVAIPRSQSQLLHACVDAVTCRATCAAIPCACCALASVPVHCVHRACLPAHLVFCIVCSWGFSPSFSRTRCLRS